MMVIAISGEWWLGEGDKTSDGWKKVSTVKMALDDGKESDGWEKMTTGKMTLSDGGEESGHAETGVVVILIYGDQLFAINNLCLIAI